jgi:tetratricopeptide (TPR) repeat protein
LQTDRPVDETAEIERPKDLQQLDRAVVEQFQTLWERLREPEKRSDETTAVGAAWGELGQWFDIYGYAESAGRCYHNARSLDPREPKWPHYLGLLAEEAGDLDAARAYYAEAAALAPDAMEPRVRLGDLALERHDLEAAETIYGEVLATDPQSPGALLGSGRLALARGNAAAAIPPLETIVRLQPDAAEVHYTLGLAWRQLGDEEAAAEHLQQVPAENIDHVPLRPDAPWEHELQALDHGARNLTRRGVRALRRGDHTRAVVLLGRAVAADPDGAEKRINYAVALRRAGRRTSAREQLEEALARCASRSELAVLAHLELGRLDAVEGRGQAAFQRLESALAIDPDSVDVRLELGRLHHRLGRLDEALHHYAAVRETDRAVPATRFWHAALLIQLDRRPEAIAALEEDRVELGAERRLSLLLARILSAAAEVELRDPDRARRLLTDSTTRPDVLFSETAAMVAAAEGRFADAIAWQRAAVAALAGARPRAAAHIARRRLVLYERRERCRNPWEERETLSSIEVDKP